jgi:hypothetical protein
MKVEHVLRVADKTADAIRVKHRSRRRRECVQFAVSVDAKER